MHVRDQRAFQWFEMATQALGQCDCLALEIELGASPPPDWSRQFRLPPGGNLENLLGPKAFEKGSRILKKAFDVTLSDYQHSLPMLVVQAIDAEILKGDHPVALDEALFRTALQEGKTVIGLETMESQIQLLQRIPIAYQVRQLKKIIRSVSNHRRSLSRYAQLYEAGRINQIYKAARSGAGSMRRELIDIRNQRMVAALLEQMRSRSVFAAVGAGHLPGKAGMLRLLKQAGCNIQAVERRDYQ